MSHQRAVQLLLAGVTRGERSALARAITLVESTHPQQRVAAQSLMAAALAAKRQRNTPPAFRLGLSGPPGAGKSTFIEALGSFLTARQHRVAVLVRWLVVSP